MLIDSHCHLHLIDYIALGSDLDAVMQLAKQDGIEHMLCVGTIVEDLQTILAITERYPEVSASLGLHPNETVTEEPTIESLLSLATHPKVIAIGETGLDYYRTKEGQPWQQNRFRMHIEVAKMCRKPLIIHTRQARQDTLSILKEEQANTVRGVFHCFTEDWETAKAALDLDFFISFSGIVTFKNAVELQAVAKQVPLNRLLIETDSPYLAPVPHRGKINQPAYVKHVASFLAALHEISMEEIAENTTNNFYQLFKR